MTKNNPLVHSKLRAITLSAVKRAEAPRRGGGGAFTGHVMVGRGPRGPTELRIVNPKNSCHQNFQPQKIRVELNTGTSIQIYSIKQTLRPKKNMWQQCRGCKSSTPKIILDPSIMHSASTPLNSDCSRKWCMFVIISQSLIAVSVMQIKVNADYFQHFENCSY